jgi:hypothetical protein
MPRATSARSASLKARLRTRCPSPFAGAMARYVCVSQAAAIVAPLDTLIAGAQMAMPSKYVG